MNIENNIKIFYPACGHDLWTRGGLGGSLRIIREVLDGNGPISDKIPDSLDIVYCDINPNLDIQRIAPEVSRLFRGVNNSSRKKYFSKTTSQLYFHYEHDDNFEVGFGADWKVVTWMHELIGKVNGIRIRFRYFSASYEQTMCYLIKTGWKLGKDDVILLGTNWRYYGEGGQNLHTIFQEPLCHFFDGGTKVITRVGWNPTFQNEFGHSDINDFSVRSFSQGFWEESYG